jgi:putative intracellular protease/amidase
VLHLQRGDFVKDVAMKRVLMIVTSNARMGETGKPTGVWAEELAVPYFAFIDAGAAVEFASPRGGSVPFDPASIKDAGTNHAAVERLLNDATLQARLAATIPVATVDGAVFDAVFFPGGHGTMWDLPHASVGKVAGDAFQAGRLVGSVCHGAAGLVSAVDATGKPIVNGRRINSFTNAEETAAGLMNVVPFALESRLRELGGLFEGAANWQAFSLRDGQLITGQNPASSASVAALIIDALGLAAPQTKAA